jgi:mRNA-degrading endonuclease RelE of RelBE toxin-antitoxin system
MPKYELVLSPAAKRDLKRLPLNVQEGIAMVHLPNIAERPYEAGKPLVGALRRERSYHFGRKPEYRIIYLVEESLITVTLIGTREGLYKRAVRRK